MSVQQTTHSGFRLRNLQLSVAERALARLSVEHLYQQAERAPLRSRKRAALLASAARMSSLARELPALARNDEDG
jgi:hypothetical protein